MTGPTSLGDVMVRPALDDDVTHWVCCLDAACVQAKMPSLPEARAFCGEIPTIPANRADVEDLEVDCSACLDLEDVLDRSGRCPVRGEPCPQCDDICEGGDDA